MIDHSLLKTVHILSVVLWMGTMIVTPILLVRLSKIEGDRSAVAVLRGVMNRVMTPAMIVTLGLGLWMATSSGWFREPWVMGKLGIALVLAVLHGLVSGQMRRAATSEDFRPSGRLAIVSAVALVCLLAAIYLAVAKPG